MGKSLLEVHQEQAQGKIRQMMETKGRNVYTIEKDGVRVLVYQSPWYREGKFAGLVEVGLEVPAEIPHYVVRAASWMHAVSPDGGAAVIPDRPQKLLATLKTRRGLRRGER